MTTYKIDQGRAVTQMQNTDQTPGGVIIGILDTYDVEVEPPVQSLNVLITEKFIAEQYEILGLRDRREEPRERDIRVRLEGEMPPYSMVIETYIGGWNKFFGSDRRFDIENVVAALKRCGFRVHPDSTVSFEGLRADCSRNTRKGRKKRGGIKKMEKMINELLVEVENSAVIGFAGKMLVLLRIEQVCDALKEEHGIVIDTPTTKRSE